MYAINFRCLRMKRQSQPMTIMPLKSTLYILINGTLLRCGGLHVPVWAPGKAFPVPNLFCFWIFQHLSLLQIKMPIHICQDTDSLHDQCTSGLKSLEIIYLCGKISVTLRGTAKFTFVRKVEGVSNLRILNRCQRASEQPWKIPCMVKSFD